MLLEKQIQILVFRVDDTTFENIGEVNQYGSLIWPDKFNGYASFELLNTHQSLKKILSILRKETFFGVVVTMQQLLRL